MPHRFSIASFSFHGLMAIGEMDVFRYFEAVRHRFHLDAADIWNGMLISYDDDYLRRVRRAMDECGLTLVNLCCDKAHIWSDGDEERAIVERGQEDCLRAAEILGAASVRFDLGIGGADATDQQIEFCARQYDRLCARAARFGARLGPENHWGASTNVAAMRRLFQAVRADNFGLLLHLGNWQKSDPFDAERAAQYDQEFIGRAMHTHVMYEVCEQAERRLPPLAADYAGAWGIESHKGTNELNNVAYQLASVRRVVAPVDYARPPMSGPGDPFFKILMDKLRA
ncbi:MAG: TIM barrel protein [Clostridiales bacterium]|nr:TIM barrel protein [Clostridiales bacterium]